jgi:hypothetical protein
MIVKQKINLKGIITNINMRKASQDNGLIVIDDKFIGISLGHDYCAEHEWGIENMRRRFGIKDGSSKCMGVDNRTISKNINNLVFKEETYKKVKYALLYTGYSFRTLGESQENIPRDIKDYKKDITWNMEWQQRNPPKEGREPKDPIVTAWDEEGFGVGVMGEKEVQYLKDLYEAFQNLNIAIAVINLMPNNPFSNNSLSILIADRLPLSIKINMYAADKEHYDRVDYEEKIGMTKIKAKYGNKNGHNKKNYFMACSAKWINYDDAEARERRKKELKTKYDIQYWVNYSDDDNNHGYYTVEEIREWLTGSKKLTEIRKA